ncbi:MAG: efflux RND transporter permease subunit [Planctomycetota bacterium]
MSLPAWGVRRPVPVNLLMIALLVAGAIGATTLRKEFLPETDPTQALVSMPYPGATPAQVEESLAIKIEDKLVTLDEVKELRTTVSEGGGGITVEFRDGVDIQRALDEVQREIDALRDLPGESEEIEVELFEPRLPVIRVAVFGSAGENSLKRAIRAIRDDLRSLPGMGEITIDGVRDYELRIDVDRGKALQQGLSLPAISDAVRRWLSEVPGGTVKTDRGNFRLRGMGLEERAQAIADVPVQSGEAGATVLLGDIATVSDGFVDEQIANRFNGQPAAMLTVFKVGDQDVVQIAETVRGYVAGRNGDAPDGFEGHQHKGAQAGYELGRTSSAPLPPGAQIATSTDLARFVEGRLDLLVRNAAAGLVLVFAILLIFLDWRSAMWVGVGLSTAMGGTLVLMQTLDVTLNLLTMFGLIVVIGLLVDDAIVVAENVRSWRDRGEAPARAAAHGAQQVFWPVCATVATSIVAFLPLTFIKGDIGDLLGALPLVVACALAMSLIESVLILPSHMRHALEAEAKARGPIARRLVAFESWRDRAIVDRVNPGFGRALAWCLRRRYLVMAVALSGLMVSAGLIAGGRLNFTFLSDNDAETVVIELRTPIGSSIGTTDAAVRTLEAAAAAQPEVLSIATVVGQRTNVDTGASESAATHVGQLYIELHPVESRDRDSQTVIDAIRTAALPDLREVERLSFTEISGGPGGSDITVRVLGKADDAARMELAVAEIKKALAGFGGVYDISDDLSKGQLEIRITPRPADARALGLDAQDVKQQIRAALFGVDAHVFAESEEDIDVRVRLDEATRRDLAEVLAMWVVAPDGRAVPLAEIADVEEAASYAGLSRVDRKRSITVSADTEAGLSPENVTAALDPKLDALRAQFPELEIAYAGRQENVSEAFASLPYGFLAAVGMIYILLAFLFDSFLQPIVVVSVIPFAVIGVVWGHLALGFDLTFLSLIGFVALSGIVVNDSLILVQFYNQQRERGAPIFDALVHAGRARLRPIFLTTVTTALGLTPLMLEQSFQARFLIPMAISIAMGLVSATVMILIVLPCMILAMDDVKGVAYWLWHGRKRPQGPPHHPDPEAGLSLDDADFGAPGNNAPGSNAARSNAAGSSGPGSPGAGAPPSPASPDPPG